jgi:uncharacterized protein YndB with AHSA1/START domain
MARSGRRGRARLRYRGALAGSRTRVPTNERFMPVPAAAIWDALADPDAYRFWVVGSKLIRDADPDWPAPGSRFHHTIAVGPFTVSDQTTSLDALPPSRLQIRAKGRPLGTARVTLEMTPKDGGTLVRMTETPDGPTAVLNVNPVVHVFTKTRNAESLMRLEELALRRAP